MTNALRAGMDFISALDQGTIGGIAAVCAPGATWWVDTGPDRAAGDPEVSPGGSGRFPLHGVMSMSAKLDLMRGLGKGAFPKGCRQTPRRVIAGEKSCVIEVDGYGLHASGEVYANRYGFVFDVNDAGLVTSVREYLDTIHAQQVVGAGESVPRVELTSGDSRSPLSQSPPDSAATVALALWPLLSAGDVEAFARLFSDEATWWTDSGRDRRRGRLFAQGDIDANGPFHGVVAITDKLAAIRARLASGSYRSAAVEVTPHRVIVDDQLVAIEASGDARLAHGLRYQNRYLWVVEVTAGKVKGVREYCDTLHIAELMDYPEELGPSWKSGTA